MSSRRRPPPDLAAVKRSRSSFFGAITRAKDKFLLMKEYDIADINTKTVDRTLTSILGTETGFYGTIEDAQPFIAEEDAQDNLQREEDEANESFITAISEVRDLGEELLNLKSIRKGLDDFKCDLSALQELVCDQPEQTHTNALQALEETHSNLRQEWRKADLNRDHPLKSEIDTIKKLLTQLSVGIATQREARDIASSSIHSSTFSSPHRDRELETKLPTIDVPTFHGVIMKWSTFWSSFKATIDSRNMSNTNKLTYLRKAIKDPDSQTLLHSTQETPDFYLEVVKALQARFNRTKEIHRNLVQTLVHFQPVKNTRSDLRKRVDDLKHSISSLQHTGHYVIQSLLTSMVYHTLPVKLQTLWEQHVKKIKGVSPIDDLLAFLSDHAETLPSSQAPPTPTSVATPSQHRKNPYKGERKPKPGIHAVTPVPAAPTQSNSNYRWDCIFCKPEKHPLFLCSKWLGFSISQRLSQVQSKNLCNICLSVGHSTESCRSSYRCRECGSNHHMTLHQSAAPPTAPPTVAASVAVNSATVNQAKIQSSILMTTQVLLTGPRGQKVQARAFIDPGAAMSLISSKVAQQLNLPLEKTHLQFSAVLATPCKAVKHLTNLSVSPLQGGNSVLVRAAVVSTVTGDIPAQEIDPVDDLPHLSGLGLADPTFYLPGKVDILLGSEVYPQLMLQKPMITGAPSEPAALQTIFGWAIIGPVRSKGSYIQPISTQCAQVLTTNEDLDALLSTFWKTEEPEHPSQTLSQMEEQVQSHYSDTFSYCSSACRYQVSLPWKPDAPPLGDSRAQALSRYISNERSILRRNIWRPFQDVVQSYLDLGHAELVPKSECEPEHAYYLPMHCVSKQSSTSTKLRVVFDGSAVSTTGCSLNQSLMVGPTLHPTLENILLRFRAYPVALTADIAKMYREVELSEPDRDFHRFLWRSTPEKVIQDYRMTRVTFGVSASPYLAVRTLQQTAADHGQDHPEAAQHVRSSFYVDDLLAGANSVEAALQLYSDLRTILKRGGLIYASGGVVLPLS